MRKIIISILFFLPLFSLSFTAMAQTYFGNVSTAEQECTYTQNSYNIVITRGIYPNMALTYQEHTSNTYNSHFVLNDNATDVYVFDLPAKVHVTDFQQVDDQKLVVFCGYIDVFDGVGTHTEGVIGWFVPDGTPSNYNIMQFSNIDIFKKIAGYTYNSKCNLVALGKYKSGVWYERIIYVEDLINSLPPNKNYKQYDIPQGQIFYDIVKTRDYLVFYGKDNGLCLRRETYSDMAVPNLLQYYYIYPNAGFVPADDTYATYLGNTLNRQNNLIAVGGPFLNENNGTFDARYYTFDATTMTMTHAQKFKMYGKASTSGITYLSDYKKLAILHFQNPLDGSYATPIILLDPFPISTYSANFFIHPDIEFYTIDKLNYSINNVNHLLLGANTSNGYQWFLRSSQCGTNMYNPCNKPNGFEVETINIIEPTQVNNIGQSPNSTPFYIMSLTPVQYTPKTVQCVNQIRQ